ncbi:MAG TPA: YbaB/EbfC family nucleoid-associated protein [Firmicutes bacterium]|jgi:DNA-binding YbaB/EbfC family protein|nr:YbaB/EbfC family nucleoid-associated protein [Bacillota bacterium]
MNGKMGKMLKQVQKAQAQILKLQEELAQRTMEATSGGGAVRAVSNGAKELVELHIDPEILQEEEVDVEMIQDLVITAVNESLRQADKMMAKEMEKISGGMGLPPGMF